MSLKSKLSLSSGRAPKSSEGLWAISYADFLMVLLSFFIIFFSMDEKNSLHRIFLDMKKSGVVQDVAAVPAGGNGKMGQSGLSDVGNANGEVQQTVVTSNRKLILELSSKIQSSSLIKHVEREKLILQLPENIYVPGDYLPKVALLDPIILQLKPYGNSLRIKIIGHSDTIAFKDAHKRIIKDNLTLSSVRASYTANYFKAFYPDMSVTTSADDQHVRQTRSISIEIEATEVAKK